MLRADDVAELLAAERLGMIPDWWLQTGTIAAAVCNASGAYNKTIEPSDFIPKVQHGPEDPTIGWQQQMEAMANATTNNTRQRVISKSRRGRGVDGDPEKPA